MINNTNLPKAYKEVMEILKYIPKEDFDKIPKELINMYENKMDKKYQYKITCFDNFDKQDMLNETVAILAVLFRDYWATEEQKKRIKLNEEYQLQLLEEEKKKKYNVDNLFKNKSNNVIKDNNIIEDNNLPVEVKERNFFEKIILYIRKMFRK